MSAPDIELRSITKRFGKVEAVKDLNLSIEKGQLCCLLGPSGCGKTTTLRVIAGFEAPTKGRITVQGEDITDLSPNKRNTGMVFQNYALFPHMTVFKNMAYGLENRKVPKDQIRKRVKDALDMVDMAGMEGRYPRQLSGGQQQRVAVGRVLVMEPKILLFDEPLSNLDAKLRLQMRAEIRNLQKKVGITTIFVTHDQEEALSIADTVVVMNQGVVEQIGSPSEIYDAPETRFMANFIGTSNIFEGTFEESQEGKPPRLRTPSGLEMLIGEVKRPASSETLSVAVRPENMTICLQPPNEQERDEGHNGVPIVVEDTLRMGPISQYSVRLETGEQAIIQSQYRTEDQMLKKGDKAWLLWHCSSCLPLRE